MKQRKKKSTYSNGPFVMLSIEVLDAPAWRAISHGAQVLYIALRRRYNATTENNGKIYLPQRIAQNEIHSHRDQIARWFRELQHYGFIVMTSQGHLGVHGSGRAPCWRLTELPSKTEPPTKDFLAWNGVPFGSQKNRIPARKSGPRWPGKQGQANGISESSPWPGQQGQCFGPENGAKSRFALHG
jgi:hypothetical protein